jgi:hypothetical protein
MEIKKITDYLNLTTPIKEETNSEPNQTKSDDFYTKQEPLEELLSWKISAPNFQISKKILRSGFVLVFLFAIFLVLAQDWMFLLVLLGMTFLVNLLLNNKDNRDIDYKIFNNGFMYGTTFYSWEQLSQFFYYEGTSNLLIIESKDVLPGRIYVYFKIEDKEKIDSVLNKYLFKNIQHPKDFYEFVFFKIKPYLSLSDEK